MNLQQVKRAAAVLLIFAFPCSSVEVVGPSNLTAEDSQEASALVRSEASHKTKFVEVLPSGSLEVLPTRPEGSGTVDSKHAKQLQSQLQSLPYDKLLVPTVGMPMINVGGEAAAPLVPNFVPVPSDFKASVKQSVSDGYPGAREREKEAKKQEMTTDDTIDPTQSAWPDGSDQVDNQKVSVEEAKKNSITLAPEGPDSWKKYLPDKDEQAPSDARSFSEGVGETFLRLGMGVGPIVYARSPGAQQDMKHELRQRLVTQDKATVLILIFVLFIAVFVSCLGVYQFADDPSHVYFYSDPKYNLQRMLCSTIDMDNFMETFNSQPQVAVLRIIGRQPGAPRRSWFSRERDSGDGLRRFGRRLLLPNRRDPADENVIFNVSLDLTSFINGDGEFPTEEEAAKLEQHLTSNNPLEILVLRKKVMWEDWVDVATNIRQKLRSEGFEGDIEIRFDSQEDMRIYRNNRWQNFIRMPVTHILAVLSCLGLLFWLPYLYARSSVVVVQTHFHIEMDVERYWEMLTAGLSAQEGFSTPDNTN
mmetsp:Transcript_759/g.1386  ORF Transcript_759/g.1386 Transcript_759/m.1386 type:complete len:531 (-) Transcript_759:53-1645(-)|eukprot:CAMPEP_0197663308 /NCGR_PEP_ID=MMETSP1338-20131121/56902_1 /TAXON_ID=43686 ORGANISM="Pelagodinium beii, Strain RCC1491" /NCGR_SAMPLE_ID=MMETSP1338 /ASSEMBLY_ACC=CAM_ASM_000754 /LENGTH=530 /DNA_ID=CAMNT_0043241605 /DNA_START=139 /DNA_END=1731 /DNA_ORIENTATION=-